MGTAQSETRKRQNARSLGLLTSLEVTRRGAALCTTPRTQPVGCRSAPRTASQPHRPCWLQVSTSDSHTASPSAGQTFAPPPPSPRPHLSHLPHPDLSFHETTSQVQQLDPASTFLLSTPAQTLLSITSLPVSERAGYLWGYSVVSGPGVLHTQMRCRPIHLTPKG